MSATDSPRATIVLVEDDPTVASMLRDRFGAKGYCVWHAVTAAEAEGILDEVKPDLVIVDLMLPDAHGLVLCADLRERSAAPIIICSGTKRKDDQILGFKLGADDFVGKPFSTDELEARVEAALRRAAPSTLQPQAEPGAPTREHRVSALAIVPARCQVTLGDEELRLTPTEYKLLCTLASRPDEVISRRELAERVWGFHDPGVDRSLDVHIRRLRCKLNAGPVPPPPLVTLRGFGYRLAREADSLEAHAAARRA
jgi:DNA-binding response OmpR family regulator